MLVRPLIVLFALMPPSAVHAQTLSQPVAAAVLYAGLQPPLQPGAEPAPEPNPTSQPAAPPLPVAEPNPTSQPATPAEQPPAPVVRVPEAETPAKAEAKDARKFKEKQSQRPVNAAAANHPTLWHDPGNIGSLNLFYGQGGEKGMPAPPLVFESEDSSGTNPKFDARDAKDRTWRVKLGDEARPEVVASRLLWAAGYYVSDDYVLQTATVQGIRLKRGGSMVKNEQIADARFARKPSGQKKIGTWKWKENPFTNTKEFNGLRVMMALINNWDLKDVNNAVFEDAKTGEDIYLTSDVGATFGTNGLSWTHARSKGNVESFKDSKFIVKTTDSTVSFGTPKPPTARLIETLALPEAKDYAHRAGMEWIGRDVPRQDARWMGSLLKQLSHQQLMDAFRAGQFPPDQIDAYVGLVESRIQELSAL